MKTSSFLAGLAVGLLGLVAFAWAHRPPAGDASLQQLQETAWLQRELKLDDAQVRQLDALQHTFSETLEDCCAHHCSARERMGEAVFKAGPDAGKLQDLMAEMGHAQLESDLATVKHMQAVHALLRPDQQARYEKLVTRCVCGDCPNKFDHHKTGEAPK